jgi:hypothetical protein
MTLSKFLRLPNDTLGPVPAADTSWKWSRDGAQRDLPTYWSHHCRQLYCIVGAHRLDEALKM